MSQSPAHTPPTQELMDQVITTRRTTKSYDPTFKLSEAEFNHLMHNALQTPSSFNIQHWRYIRITDPAIRTQLRAVALDQPQVTDAAELLVITADTQAWQKEPERYWQSADPEKRQMIVNLIQQFYSGREWLQRDEAIRSGALAAQTLMLAATAMGLDTTPMIGIDFDGVARLIQLPDDHVIVMLLAIGKANQPAWPKGGQLPLDQVLFENSF